MGYLQALFSEKKTDANQAFEPTRYARGSTGLLGRTNNKASRIIRYAPEMKNKALAAIIATTACAALNAIVITLLVRGHIGDAVFATCFLGVIGFSIFLYKIDEVSEFAVGSTLSAKLRESERINEAVKELARHLADVAEESHKHSIQDQRYETKKVDEALEKIRSLTRQ